VVLLAPIRVSAAVPNPVLRADSCLNSYVVLVVLEERGVDLIWDIGQVPAKNFDWLPFIPPLWSPSPVLQSQLLLCTRKLILVFNSACIKRIRLNYDKLNDDYAREMNLNCT
jgi:hypothetical protein